MNRIIENDTEDSGKEPEDIPEEEVRDDRRDNYDDENDTGDYESTGLEGRVQNSIGRSAVENWIKNSVYEKYNIDAKAMREYARMSPTEMLSSFGDSVKELGQLRKGDLYQRRIRRAQRKSQR